MISIIRRSLMPAVRQRVDRARESMRDPKLQTALATVVACLELLAILLWIKTDILSSSLGWSLFSYTLLFVLMISPLWPSRIIQRRFEEVNAKHINIAYWVFSIPVMVAYTVIFIL